MSGLLLGIVLSVCTCWFHSMVSLPPWLVSNDFGTRSYHCFLSNCSPVPCICWSVVVHTLYHVFLCTVLLPVLGMLILFGLSSHQIVGKFSTCYLSLCSKFLSHNILFVLLLLLLFSAITIIRNQWQSDCQKILGCDTKTWNPSTRRKCSSIFQVVSPLQRDLLPSEI